jgi:hypothetical protein
MKAVNKFQGYEHVKVSLDVTPRGTGISGTKLRNSLKNDSPEQALAIWSNAFDVNKLGVDWIKHLMDITRKGMGIQQKPEQPAPIAERLLNALILPKQIVSELDTTHKKSWADYGMPDKEEDKKPKEKIYHGWDEYNKDKNADEKEHDVDEDWNKVNHHDKTNGLSRKAVKAYRREHPGSKLQTAVTTKPSKLKAGSKAAKRRKSFCARMSGNKGPMKKPNGKPTPKALALRRWHCESVEEMQQLIMLAEQEIASLKKQGVAEAGRAAQQAAFAISKQKEVDEDQRLDPHCWKGYRKAGTKMKGGTRVNKCVPVREDVEDLMAGYIKLLENKR